MKEFKSLSSFHSHLTKICAQYEERKMLAMRSLGEHLVKEAKDSIGELQGGAGPFPAWDPLAESTKQDKERKGFVYNDDYNPLLRTGELRDSIDFSVQSNKSISTLYLGSNDDVMIYQELGTSKIPPRSVLGMTMFKQSFAVARYLQNFMHLWIQGKPPQGKVKKWA